MNESVDKGHAWIGLSSFTSMNQSTGNDRYSGHGYSGIDRYSGTKNPDDAILFTVSGITAIVEQKFRFFSENFDALHIKDLFMKDFFKKNFQLMTAQIVCSMHSNECFLSDDSLMNYPLGSTHPYSPGYFYVTGTINFCSM